jgi:hypothetical protein
MAESVTARAKRYAKGDFTKRELTTLSGVLLADKAIDLATFGRLNKLSATALKRIVIPAVSVSGRIAGQAALGTARVLGSSAVGAAAPIVTNPYVAGTALGLGALATPPGQALLEAAEERGRMDRIRFEQGLTDLRIAGGEFGRDLAEVNFPSQKMARKKTKSAFNKAVSKGMKVVKASTSYGKKGTINNAKKAFTAVTKTASKINKGGKVAKSGITRKIGLAIKGILK